jgi:hypothetical protein
VLGQGGDNLIHLPVPGHAVEALLLEGGVEEGLHVAAGLLNQAVLVLALLRRRALAVTR